MIPLHLIRKLVHFEYHLFSASVFDQRLVLRRDRASFCDICQHTLSRFPFVGFLSHHGTKTTWAMAFPRISCCTTTATVLTATATVTLSLRACLFLCSTPIISPSAADSFNFHKAARDGLALRHLSRQGTSREASSDRWRHGAPASRG